MAVASAAEGELLDVWEHTDATLAALAGCAPNADGVTLSSYADPRRLSAAARIDLLAALQKQAAWIAARELDLLAVIDTADTTVDRWDTQEVAAVLRVAPPTAAARLRTARRLAEVLNPTWRALHAGQISARHASTLTELVSHLTDPVAADVEARVLARAGQQTVGEFRTAVRRAVLALDPAGETQRHQAAAADRRVVITPDDNAMAQLWALLPAAGAATIRTAIDAIAAETNHGHGGDHRTADQRRADALVTMADAVLGDPHMLRRHGRAPNVQVTLAASTLLGLDDQPGELAGYGPVPAATARRLATEAGAEWRRLLTDDTGHLIDYAPTTYRPPQALRDFVIARDQHCTFPGCTHPATSCDLDHLRPNRIGGATCPANLHPLCRHHHRCKHGTDWHPTRAPDGTTHWRSPTGHTYTTEPPPLPLPTTAPSRPTAGTAGHDPPPF